jgi:lipopolysaccharide transport system ATP-binding protein
LNISNEIAVSLQGVGKMYRMYPSRLDITLDATGLINFFPWRKAQSREFWALRNINLEIKKGERLGIIGRNGAGKTTMLKLLTGNLVPTEGQVIVNGGVQALLTSGAGFHPEFTGYENIRSSLVYQGLTSDQIESAVWEIADFTELGDFLNQPFKLYSAGMQARLTFATATVLNPDILIVDEILGAGDAYFFGKSIERMKGLVLGGATVLIVSHAMDQISRFCDEAIWIDRGNIVYRGPSLDTIAAYEEYTHKLEDRRLQARNRKRLSGETTDDKLRQQNDILTMKFSVPVPSSRNGLDLSQIDLYEGAVPYESLKVGDAQDSNAVQSMYIPISPSSAWSNPIQEGARTFRRLGKGHGTSGDAKCYLYLGSSNERFTCVITYRARETSQIEFSRNDETIVSEKLPVSADWVTQRIDLGSLSKSMVTNKDATIAKDQPKIRRWASEGSILIEGVQLLDGKDRPKALFRVGNQMKVKIALRTQKSGRFTIRPAVTIRRTDGVHITNLISGELFTADLQARQRFELEFNFGNLNLGNGQYVISPSIFKDSIVEEDRYDLVAHAYEFEVTGSSEALANYIFVHPGNWSLVL